MFTLDEASWQYYFWSYILQTMRKSCSSIMLYHGQLSRLPMPLNAGSSPTGKLNHSLYMSVPTVPLEFLTDNQVKFKMTEAYWKTLWSLSISLFLERAEILRTSQKQTWGSFPSVCLNSSNLLKNMVFKKVKCQPTAFTNMALLLNGGIHS